MSSLSRPASICPQEHTRGNGQIVALDLFRALAAFMVVVVHARGSAFVDYGSLPKEQQTRLVEFVYFLSRIGQEAVLAFFMLSGLLVAGAIIRRVSAGTFDLRLYAIERATRIL